MKFLQTLCALHIAVLAVACSSPAPATSSSSHWVVFYVGQNVRDDRTFTTNGEGGGSDEAT